jgi:hypothetical protein
MATLSFNEILIRIGFSPEMAKKQVFVLDTLIAEKIRLNVGDESKNDQNKLDEIIKEEIHKTYEEYMDYMIQNSYLSQRLLIKAKLNNYLEGI